MHGPGLNAEPCKFIDIRLTLNRTRTIDEPTQLDNALDLLLTNVPDCANSIASFPGKSEHNVISMSLSLPIVSKRTDSFYLQTVFQHTNSRRGGRNTQNWHIT